MGPRSIFLKALPFCLLLAPVAAAADDFADLVSAERAFAADAGARSTRDAFLAVLADDSLLFAPGPTSGRRVWEARKEGGNRLEWTPEVAEVAASGDLGYTSGPWRLTPEGKDKPVAFGHFFSIWKKQADGAWKLLIDHGIGHAEVPFPEKTQRRGALTVGEPPGWAVGLPELRSADLAPPGALSPRQVAGDFLRLRDGQLPDGKAEGNAFPSSARRLDTGLVISAGGDLAATWGGGADSPAWIRVWRRPSAGDAPGQGWQLAVDLSLPAATGPAP